MKQIALIFLLLAAFAPMLYYIFVFANFEVVTKQSWFYSDYFRYFKSLYALLLLAIYAYIIKINKDVPKENKGFWYMGVLLFAPVVMPLFWFKYAWPAASKSLSAVTLPRAR